MKSFLLFLCLFSLSVLAEDFKPKYGPLKNPLATPLHEKNDFMRKNPAADFYRLISYYVSQENDYSCSVATALNILNAARAKDKKNSDFKNIQIEDLLSRVTTNNWKARVSSVGDNGKHGVNLDEFASNLEAAFKAYEIKYKKIEALRFSKDEYKFFKKLLLENEKNPNDFLVVNFLQSALTDDAEVGHFSTIAAYNAKAEEVLILDPDRLWYEPYWGKAQTLWKAISTTDNLSGKTRGLVHIELN